MVSRTSPSPILFILCVAKPLLCSPCDLPGEKSVYSFSIKKDRSCAPCRWLGLIWLWLILFWLLLMGKLCYVGAICNNSRSFEGEKQIHSQERDHSKVGAD